VRQQGTLVDLIALGLLRAGIGQPVPICKVGLPRPGAVWIGGLIRVD